LAIHFRVERNRGWARMTKPRTVNVVQDAQAILLDPGLAKATVGPGFAVVVCSHSNGASCAGLLHLPFYQHETKLDTPAYYKKLGGRLEAFIAQLPTPASGCRGAEAQIIGGADILRLFPRNVRDRVARRNAAAIEALLRSKNIQTKKVVVGGTRGRSVSLELADDGTSACHVSRVGSSKSNPADRGKERSLLKRDSRYKVLNVEVGKMIVDSSPTKLSVILGSCVGVALVDTSTGIGGLTHVMTPSSRGEQVKEPSQYADRAVPALVEAVVKAGAARQELRAKIAGGANVLNIGNHSHMLRIGEQNANNVKASLAKEGIPLISEDVGGSVARKMWVDLSNFEVKIKTLQGN
jgi:chemotaxis protein CheD